MNFSLKHLSSRFHLALGLSSLVVTVLLMAQFAGLVPDREGALRSARVSLAETVAVTSMVMLDEQDRPRLAQVLEFMVKRNPDLRTVSLRRADGSVYLQAGAASAEAQAVPEAEVASMATQSTDTHLRLQLAQPDGAAWGQAELQFEPLHDRAHWRSWIGSYEPSLSR